MEMKGIHAIKVSPLEGNLCLLEEMEAGYIEDFLGQKDNWWNMWFSEIKRWELGVVDEFIEVWLRIYEIPALAWHSDFFVKLAEAWGSFICIDEKTADGKVMDVARVMLRVPLATSFPNCLSVSINGVLLKVTVREDVMGIVRSSPGGY
ncbi:uncharacterized protein LOC131636617 [Vicia villosa]|uniref:uncharacterized protein LOC131636617 n=1 Tax=Vicia villosa TaxID=3911 RepID=UPI00273B927A|nr:uncharacterized protein LOC131636617 [Vicia villosa]